MDTNSPQVEMLKRLVEERSMLAMDSFKDFQLLYDEMRRRNNETLGVNTLRRLWGDISGYPTVREATLDVLCRFVGYPDWHTFVADYCGREAEQTSCNITTASVQALYSLDHIIFSALFQTSSALTKAFYSSFLLFALAVCELCLQKTVKMLKQVQHDVAVFRSFLSNFKEPWDRQELNL